MYAYCSEEFRGMEFTFRENPWHLRLGNMLQAQSFRLENSGSWPVKSFRESSYSIIMSQDFVAVQPIRLNMRNSMFID